MGKIATCLPQKLNVALLNKVQNVQVSDTRGDATEYFRLQHKNDFT